ncbi:MAG: ankyrin repeat domain-containing protein, partial [Methanosarcinales archaeon]
MESVNEAGWKPLHSAYQQGRAPYVRALSCAGANVEAMSRSAFTPLHLACRAGDDDACVRALLGAGANPMATTHTNFTPLHIACDEGAVLCLHDLLEAGAHADAMSKHGRTALYAAHK